MKKILSLILIVFIISGCSVKYDLDLTNVEEAYEQLHVVEDDKSDYYFNTLKNYDDNVPALYVEQDPDTTFKDSNLEYYDIENADTLDTADFTLSHTFPNKEIINSNIIRSCYDSANIVFNKNNIDISTSNTFLCFKKYISLDDVEINIKTNHKITYTNADKIDGNTYTWYINKDASKQKPIRITSVLNQESNQTEEQDPAVDYKIIIIALLLFAVFIVGIFIYNNHKYKE